MRTLSNYLNLSIFLTLAFGFADPAAAQFRNVPPKYEEFHLVNLLGFPSIRDHLVKDYELSNDNLKTLAKLGRARLENMHRRKALRMKSRKMSESQFATARAELLETIQGVNEENWEAAKELLTDAQIARLKQLRIQRIGVAALMDAEVIEALSIRDDQLEAATELKETHDEKWLALLATQRKRFKEIQFAPRSPELIAQNKSDVKERDAAKIAYPKEVFEAVLDEQQQLMLDDLKGEPFVFKFDFDFATIKVDWHTDPLERDDR